MKRIVFLIGAIVWTTIALLALAVLVIALSGVSLFKNMPNWMSGGSIYRVFDGNTSLLKEEKFSLSGITELDIGAQYQSIKITLVGGSEMTVRHYDIDSASPFTSDMSGDRLAIDIPQRNLVSYSMASPRLEIDLPRSYIDAVKLKSSSGSINLDGYVEWSSASIVSSSGTIRLGDGIKANDLNVSTSSGSINMGAAQADSINISSSSGTLRLDELKASRDVRLKSSSGSINGENITAANVKIQSSSGTVRIGNVDASDCVDISSSSGSQNAGYVKAGTYNISSTSGTLRYDGLSGAGSVDSSSGSVNCHDLDVRGNVSFSSTSGTQRITLASGQNFEIKMSVTSGTIRAASLRLQYSDSHGRNAFGTVGDGSDGTLSIRSTSGSINIT